MQKNGMNTSGLKSSIFIKALDGSSHLMMLSEQIWTGLCYEADAEKWNENKQDGKVQFLLKHFMVVHICKEYPRCQSNQETLCLYAQKIDFASLRIYSKVLIG